MTTRWIDWDKPYGRSMDYDYPQVYYGQDGFVFDRQGKEVLRGEQDDGMREERREEDEVDISALVEEVTPKVLLSKARVPFSCIGRAELAIKQRRLNREEWEIIPYKNGYALRKSN